MTRWPAGAEDLLLQTVDLAEESLQGDLLECAEHIDLQPFSAIITHLKSRRLTRPPSSPSSVLATLKAKCDAEFRSVKWRDVLRCWRRLYTDVILVWAVCDIVCSETIDFAQTIHRLDLAIIVAGTPGRGRREITLRLIALCQDLWAQQSERDGNDNDLDERPSKRLRTRDSPSSEKDEGTNPSPVHVRAHKTIPVFKNAPSMEDFSTTHYKTPFVLRGFANDWPAFQAHENHKSKWSSGEYLLSISGKGRVVPVEIGRQYTDDEWTQRIMPWEDFLTSAGFLHSCSSKDDEAQRGDVYLAQHTLLDQFPLLQRDILVPDYVYAVPDNAIDCYKSAPLMTVEKRLDEDEEETEGTGQVETRETVTTSLWIGPKGTLSPPHTDPYFNCFVQVVGSKAVWIAPPDSNDNGAMYAFGTTAHSDSSNDDAGDAIDLTNLMTNTSQVPVFEMGPSPPLYEDPHPDFTDIVESKAMHTVLGPGDLLFLPPGWWHSIKSLEKSISVSMWF